MTTASVTHHHIVKTAADLAPDIRAAADAPERGRTVDPDLIEKLRSARLFDMVVPRDYGGLEVDVITMMRAIEEVAIADGATGWCVAIGVGTAIVSAYLPEDVARPIFRPGVITGGPVEPAGRLTRDGDGALRLSGRWKFASGSPHCSWLVAGALVFDGDQPRMLEGGMPDWRLAVVPRDGVQIIDTWSVSGLRGTGSHDIAIENAHVAEERTIPFLTAASAMQGALYRFPIVSFLALSIAPVVCGIARRALDELIVLAERKTPTGAATPLRERGVAQHEVARAEATLRASRALLYETAAEAWDTLESGGRLTV
ncbi:MAG: acyl-CoA dehydrogenase family protein, partial [Dehalococcoidia bacterium]